MHTPNLTESNIEKIAALFPNCITECKDEKGNLIKAVDMDLLKQELSHEVVEGQQERYQLNWPGKREALLTANSPIAKTLRPCREESVDFDTTQNLFIEGDNLDALKLLQVTYLGKVKMIYIDPPYNTGNNFIYSDKFVAEKDEYDLLSGSRDDEGNRMMDEERWIQNNSSNGRFHSDWLSMMYPRLKLARNLLKDDGVIFISIDDNEVHNLRKICDEIYGADNFVANVIWEKKYSPQNDAKWFSDNHDHIVIYSKNKESWHPILLQRSDEQNNRYTNRDKDPRGIWKSSDLLRKDVQQTGLYSITSPSGRVCEPPSGTSWRVPEYKFKELVADNRIWFGNDGNNIPSIKRFLSEVKDGVTPTTIWKYTEVGHNQEATKELRQLFDNKAYFDTPKSIRLIKQITHIASSNNDIILDFFSGSATTAHAAMQLNAEDGGKRKFIMVQLPEPCDEKSEAFKAGYKTIAEIGKERIRRAGGKIKDEVRSMKDEKKAKDENNLFSETESNIHNSTSITHNSLDTGFRVLKIDSTNMEDVYYAPDQIEQDKLNLITENIKPERTPEDLLFQVLLDWGVDLSLTITKETIEGLEVYFVDENVLAACFAKDGTLTEDFVKDLAKREPMRAVFRDSGFKDDSMKINVEQIFKLISPKTEVKTI